MLSAVLPGGGTYDNLFMQVGISAARGAVIGATTAAIGGSDIGQGALWGGIVGGAVGFASSNQVNNWMQGKGFVSNATLADRQRTAQSLQETLDSGTSGSSSEDPTQTAKEVIQNVTQPKQTTQAGTPAETLTTTKSLNVKQTPKAIDDPYASAGGQETWNRWKYLQQKYEEAQSQTRTNTPFDDNPPGPGPNIPGLDVLWAFM